MGELAKLSMTELVKGQEQGTFSAVDVVSSFLRIIKEKEGGVRAFLTIDSASALQAAAEIDHKRKNKMQLGRLAGLPFGAKDNLCTTDFLTTCGSQFLKNYRPVHEASVIRFLKQEDAILLGKLNLDEFAMGSSGKSSAFQQTKNPHYSQHIPGGSSCGSAAAVAAGELPFALGSDSGGSVRIPASFCSVYGLKPSYGAVSRNGLVAFASSFEQIGPLAKCAKDLTLLFSSMAIADPLDATCLANRSVFSNPTLPNPLLVGVCTPRIERIKDKHIQDTFQTMIKGLLSIGCKLVEVSLPDISLLLPVYQALSSAEAFSNLSRFDGFRFLENETQESSSVLRSRLLGAQVQSRIALGSHLLSDEHAFLQYKNAYVLRQKLRVAFEQVFSHCHLLALPTCPYPVPKLNDREENLQNLDLYTVEANLTGIPALSMPSFVKTGKLPVGLQLLAPHGADNQLLSLAQRLESVFKTDAAGVCS